MKIGKIQIFFQFGKIQIFSGMRKGLLYSFFSHTDFFSKRLIFFVIYTDFVLDQSGRSGLLSTMSSILVPKNLAFNKLFKMFKLIKSVQYHLKLNVSCSYSETR